MLILSGVIAETFTVFFLLLRAYQAFEVWPKSYEYKYN